MKPPSRITLQDVRRRYREVNVIIKWYVTRKDWRYSVIMRSCSMDEFISQVWIIMLSSLKPNVVYRNALSTIVCNTCKWQLLRLNKTLKEKPKLKLVTTGRAVSPCPLIDADEDLFIQRREWWANLRKILSKRQYYVAYHSSGISGQEMPMRLIAEKMKITHQRAYQILESIAVTVRKCGDNHGLLH